jgi:hypothetical protein
LHIFGLSGESRRFVLQLAAALAYELAGSLRAMLTARRVWILFCTELGVDLAARFVYVD